MGFLRESVSVDFETDAIRLAHAFWSFTLEPGCVRYTSGLHGFLQKTKDVEEVVSESPKIANLLLLFRAAGLLTVPRQQEYKLREVAEMFKLLCGTWHAIYYSHPLWELLRSGGLSRNGFIAWALHNYHLSRSAGVTAARCATYCSRLDIRQVFLDSAVEEYSHCEDYYLVDDSRLGISAADVRSYIPLRASLAFDQQMLRIAEEDWLAHVLVGYFQESTAAYYEQCRVFYSEVEEMYGLPGFFNGWKAHIRLDHDYGHADSFLMALQSDEVVPIARVEASLSNARITAQFLLEALDEILTEGEVEHGVVLRQPFAEKSSALMDNRLILKTSANTFGWDLTQCHSAKILLDALKVTDFLTQPPGPAACMTENDFTFLVSELATAVCRSLSYAHGHDEIVSLGGLMERASPLISARHTLSTCCPPSVWCAAVTNFIRELAPRPVALALFLHLTGEWCGEAGTPIEFLGDDAARKGLNDMLGAPSIGQGERGAYATLVAQYRELWMGPSGASGELPLDLFR